MNLSFALIYLACVALFVACFATGYWIRARLGAGWVHLLAALVAGFAAALLGVFVLEMLCSYEYLVASLLNGGPEPRHLAFAVVVGAPLASIGWSAHRGVERRAIKARVGSR